MTADLRELGVVKVAAPCKRSWDKMTGDEKVRACADCQLNVYNLSAMTTDEARELIRQKEGRLCVRFFARADGTVLTKNCPKGIARQRRTMAFSFTALLALVLTPFMMPRAEECATGPGTGLSAQLRSLSNRVRIALGFEPVRPVVMGMIAPSPRVPPPAK